ncbi:MAG: recombinase family protein, partial [Xanthobacteraceae bacterium]
MSTELQLKGDSRRRQLEKSEKYAANHELELADDARLEDIGISAFKGANVRDGALGKFLEAAKAGKIAPGSFLLVESLDRLTRQDINKSLALFLLIINAGINIVTLGDERVYRAEKLDLPDFITSLVIMSRAHEESMIKSQRVSAAWASKRSQARNRPVTAMCPAWLVLSEDRTQYKTIPERAKVVRAIFDDTVAGIGNYTITRRLNQRHVPHFGRSKGWHNSYVNKILTNRAVFGEFQPHKMHNGKRVPDGEPIRNYFPPIVEKELFYRAQLARAERRVSGGGRKGVFVTNLFSGLAKCSYCGAPMKFESKGASPKGATFLVCGDAKRGLCHGTVRWRYDELEASFLAFVEQVDITGLVKNDESKKQELDDAIAACRGELFELATQMEQTYELLSHAGSAADFVGKKLDVLQERKAAVETSLNAVQTQRLSLDAAEQQFSASRDEIKAAIHHLQTTRTHDVYRMRAQVTSKMRALIDEVTVASTGTAPYLRRSIERFKAQAGLEDAVDTL